MTLARVDILLWFTSCSLTSIIVFTTMDLNYYLLIFASFVICFLTNDIDFINDRATNNLDYIATIVDRTQLGVNQKSTMHNMTQLGVSAKATMSHLNFTEAIACNSLHDVFELSIGACTHLTQYFDIMESQISFKSSSTTYYQHVISYI